MNRIVIAALLGLLALGAGAVWALGQFGQTSTVVSEPRAPLVQEPEMVAAVEPPKPATANGDAGLQSQPAPPKPVINPAKPVVKPATKPAVTPAPASAPTDTPVAEPEAVTPAEPVATPQSEPAAPASQLAANEPTKPQMPKLPDNPLDLFKTKPNTSLFRSNLDDAGKAPAPAAAPAATPADPVATPPSEPTVQVQSAPAAPLAQPAAPSTAGPSKPAQTSKPTSEPVVQTQNASVTQAAPPSGLEGQFKSRRITYNRPPEKLALDKAVDVSLVVNATEDTEAGKEALQGFKGEVVERDVELSDTVSAQLTGVGFDIVTQTVERQRLSGKVLNRWQWRVTPTEVGQHELTLAIFGYASGSLDAEPLGAYTDRIVVEVEQLDQIVTWAKGVQPIFAVLAALAAVGSACFAFLRFREEKRQTKVMGSKGE